MSRTRCHVVSRDGSSLQSSPKTDFTTIFSKCWATSLATSWAGLKGASGLRTDRPCRRRVGKDNEFNKAAPAPPAPPPAPAAPSPATGENGASPADMHLTPPASEGAEAGAVQQKANS